MDKQTLLQAINKMNKHAKDLKQKALINLPDSIQNDLSVDSDFDRVYSSTNSTAFYKSKNKIQSMVILQQQSPVYTSKSRPASRQKSQLNMSCKISFNKKQSQFPSQNQSYTSAKYVKNQSKQLVNLLNGSAFRDIPLKKVGHSHTYTHLNDRESDKFSQIQNSFENVSKNQKIRHSRSPSRQKKRQNGSTISGDEGKRMNATTKVNIKSKSESLKRIQQQQKNGLLLQIIKLQKIIADYKSVILIMKKKYSQLEDKLRQKQMSDHYIDVLKQKILNLQEKNGQLYILLDQQRKKINIFEEQFIQKITKINTYYSNIAQQNTKLLLQNNYLKQILLISSTQYKTDKKESIDNNQTEYSTFKKYMVRNLQELQSKWK